MDPLSPQLYGRTMPKVPPASPLHHPPLIRTLLPMACDGIGPSQTCIELMRGAHAAGHPVVVFANRISIPCPDLATRSSIPRSLRRLPYRIIQGPASRRLERMYLESLEPGDIAYLWPSASLAAHRESHDRGSPVVLEGINTRMKSARQILDAAYADFGADPSHGITDARIAEEEEKYRYAAAIFAPTNQVAMALQNSPLEDRVIASSYGVDTSLAPPPREYPDKAGCTVLFCGYASVRKGIHKLIEAFAALPGRHRLRIVGRIEPVIRKRYATFLASERVETAGFVRDVHAEFAKADIFCLPSFEEGDPLVTYEAALHGLPILASAMGGGRMGETAGAAFIVNPADTAAVREGLLRLTESRDLREALGRRIRQLAFRHSWQAVGASRAAALTRFLAA